MAQQLEKLLLVQSCMRKCLPSSRSSNPVAINLPLLQQDQPAAEGVSSGQQLLCNNENNSSMKTLLTPCTILKFSNNIASNMLVEEPSYRGVEAFVIIASINVLCCGWFLRISMLFVTFSKGTPSSGFFSSLIGCCNSSKRQMLRQLFYALEFLGQV
jgi:hypothetical protein